LFLPFLLVVAEVFCVTCYCQLSKARRKFGYQVLAKILLFSGATGSVSSGNLSAFRVISSKAREIVGDDVVTTGNEERCL